MHAVYIVVVFFVTALLLSIPLIPFWKVWARLKNHHPDIWLSAGPFDLTSLIASPGLIGIFISVLIRMENDKELLARDPVLGKWCRASMEIVRLLPRTFMSQVGYAFVLFCLTKLLTALLMAPFRH